MVESIKDLERLLKLCRKQGVTQITLASVSLSLGELPTKQQYSIEEQEAEEADPFLEPLTNAELVNYANGGN